MRKTLKDLFLALLNATLILVALCLFLLVLLVSKANSLSDSFDEKLALVTPIQDNIKSTLSEATALRKDLSALRDQSTSVSSDAMKRIETRIDGLNEQLSTMQGSLQTLTQAPNELVDHAIESAADQVVLGVARIKGCTAPEA